MGKLKNFNVTLRETPAPNKARVEVLSEAAHADVATQFATIDLTTAIRRQLEIPADVQGAFVSEVESDSAADEAGLHAGEVILDINRRTIHTAADAVRALNQAGTHVLLRVWSPEGSRYILVD
jgi:S1-C subfamily serine protease